MGRAPRTCFAILQPALAELNSGRRPLRVRPEYTRVQPVNTTDSCAALCLISSSSGEISIQFPIRREHAEGRSPGLNRSGIGAGDRLPRRCTIRPAMADFEIRLGDVPVGPGHPVYLVAEMACAHEGELEFARGVVDAAAEARVSAIKFQVFSGEGLVVPSHREYEKFTKFEFTAEQWIDLADRAHRAGLHVLIDVFEPWSMEVAAAAQAEGLKVHSTNVTNPFFLERVAQAGRPVLLGVGGTYEPEIRAAVAIMAAHDVPIALIHGFQAFPTPVADTHLRRMAALAADFRVPVGFAGHANARSPDLLWQNILALGLGADLLENHITLDRSESRTDHHSSMLPAEMKSMVATVRRMEETLGSGGYEIGEAESAYRATFKAFVVTARPLKAGHRLRPEDLAFKRADRGLIPAEADRILGRVLTTDLGKDEPLTEALFREDQESA